MIAVVADAENGCRVVTVWRMTTFIAMGESISFMVVTRMFKYTSHASKGLLAP